MPFDAMAAAPAAEAVVDPIQALGITPLTPGYVAAHKQAVVTRFASRNRTKRRMVEIGFARWMEFAFSELPPRQSLHAGGYMIDRSPPPREIYRLAKRIADAVPGVRFNVHAFYEDPVLEARYLLNGEWRSAMLGIWDEHGTIAVASCERRSLWDRLLRR